jgi:hypothetical protein
MTLQVKRSCIDFVAEDYRSTHPNVCIVAQAGGPSTGKVRKDPAKWVKDKTFTLRCYFSLQGEDSPIVSSMLQTSAETVSPGAGQNIYRYDWAFGITLIEDFYWDWRKELPDDGALAIHLVLKHEPFEDGPEAIPIAATLSTLHPSKNTKSIWEQALPMLPKTAAEMAKVGTSALPAMNYLSNALMLGSNVLASYTDNRKNWFLYQFFDEKLKCPVVEWQITKKVLIEYGPLIRGTLFLAFQNPAKSKDHMVRIQLRPQIRYCKTDDICYIIPTNTAGLDKQIFIDVHPTLVGEGLDHKKSDR